MLIFIFEFVWLPYKSNKLIREYIQVVGNRNLKNRFEIAKGILEEALKINSPYTIMDVRKRGGWSLIGVLSQGGNLKADKSFKDLYSLVTKEYQRFKADKTENRNHKASKTYEYLHILEK